MSLHYETILNFPDGIDCSLPTVSTFFGNISTMLGFWFFFFSVRTGAIRKQTYHKGSYNQISPEDSPGCCHIHPRVVPMLLLLGKDHSKTLSKKKPLICQLSLCEKCKTKDLPPRLEDEKSPKRLVRKHGTLF